jgi:hypothetical protein
MGMERIRHTYTVHSPPKNTKWWENIQPLAREISTENTTSCLETSPQPEQGDRGRIQPLGIDLIVLACLTIDAGNGGKRRKERKRETEGGKEGLWDDKGNASYWAHGIAQQRLERNGASRLSRATFSTV